jgi:uncharacterized radical SAM superfamily Fe-S cluster-containing enzyme
MPDISELQTQTPTQSLCPICLSRIPAYRIEKGAKTFLDKECPEHGAFRTLIWQGDPLFRTWKRPKIPATPPAIFKPIEKGCPFDCGLCPDHRQRSCTIILEVTGRCNIRCPVCYADAGATVSSDPRLSTIGKWLQRAREAAGTCNIQLSGGEPTLRDDLADIVAMGRQTGFSFIQINTNGIRLAEDFRYVKSLKDAGLASVFLQFDGLDDSVYRALRGGNMLQRKFEALAACREAGLGVVLVPTLVPGVNTEHIGDILYSAIEHSPTVRAVHFQPVSYFGRFPHLPDDRNRLTLPWLMREIESQTQGMFSVSCFHPPGCENAWCSFSGSFMILPGGKIRVLQGSENQTCCPAPIKAHEGAAKAIACVARQWAAPKKMTGKDSGVSAEYGCCDSGIMRMDDFIERARTHTLSVSAMAFQDVWNIDMDRVRDCCIHIMTPEGCLVPFCLYNLTSVNGKRLYRT